MLYPRCSLRSSWILLYSWWCHTFTCVRMASERPRSRSCLRRRHPRWHTDRLANTGGYFSWACWILLLDGWMPWGFANYDSHRISFSLLLRLMAKLCPKKRLAKPPRSSWKVTACDLGGLGDLRSSEKPKRRWRIEVGRRQDLTAEPRFCHILSDVQKSWNLRACLEASVSVSFLTEELHCNMWFLKVRSRWDLGENSLMHCMHLNAVFGSLARSRTIGSKLRRHCLEVSWQQIVDGS